MARRAVPDGVLRELGDLGVRQFLREYWQRRPLLIRHAFPGFKAPVGRDRLFALARRDDVESRLVRRTGRRWQLQQGPFAPRDLPALRQRQWTLLVQGLDGVDPAAQALLARFRFLPDARLDDLMASYATHGGGVGPHVDQYDVFLLQAAGRRRWRISRQRDQAIDARQPLKLLRDFKSSREWLLEPGDMLYLPPGVAHEGVAEGECITYSIGFRAPAYQELLDPWFARFAERAGVGGRYRDPGTNPVAAPAELPRRLLQEAHRALSGRRPRRADTEQFLLEHLTEPKPVVVFSRRPAVAAATFARTVRRRGVVLDPRSRMMFGAAGIAINGEMVVAPDRTVRGLQSLANLRALGAAELRSAPSVLLDLLRHWHQAGWLRYG
jgi:50S ribosomal protein L16 3-hydroxylase